MAQTHRFVDGVSYDESDLAEVFNSIYGTSFVIPYNDILEVTSSGAGDAKVNVAAGMAFVFGILYENTDVVSFTLSAQGGGNNRLDRIVLRRDTAANTVRLTKIEGVAAVAPSLPALTAEDMPLFYIWVADGFGAASTVANTDIHDERVFYQPAPVQDTNTIENLIANPECIVWSAPAAGRDEPEQWDSSTVPGETVVATGAIGSNTRRGRAQAVSITTAGDGIGQNVMISPDADNMAATPFTLSGTITVTSGTLYCTVNNSATVYQQRIFRRTGTYDFILRGTINFNTITNYGYVRVKFSWESGAPLVFTLGQLTFTKGYVPGPPALKKEIIKFDHEGTDAGWNATVKATGSYTVDLSATFGSAVLRSVSAVLGRVIATDDASAAAGAGSNVSLFNHEAGTGLGSYINLQQDTNSAVREDQFIVGVSEDATPSFRVGVNAQGNLAVTLKLLGAST